MEYKQYVQRSNHYLGFPNSDDEEVFTIVFDVAYLEEEDLTIELIKGNKLKISLNHGFRDTGNICFLRACIYVYSLPENIQTTNLVAYWSEDDFLIIKEKKTGETKEISNSRGDPYEQESNRALNFPATSKGNEEVKQETISPIGPSESEENIMHERKSTSSPNEIEEMEWIQEAKSTNASSESKERIMQERKSMSAFCESEEKIMQERESTSAPEENEEKVTQKKRTTTASSESSEKLMQGAKLMEASNILQTESRLIPIRVQNLFNRMLRESDVPAALNDIEKRTQFVNKFLEKHRDESHNISFN